jgi:hypothetical protein
MPPPPPPSASYTWKFDASVTDDESTDSNDHIISRRTRSETIVPVLQGRSSLDEDEDEIGEKEVETAEPEEPANEWGSWAAIIPSASKKNKQQSGKQRNNNSKKKKNRKKKNQKENKAIIVKTKNLCFGHVRIQEYERCLGIDVVPLDGSWPLGIGKKLVECAIVELTVDQYEEEKQQRLQERMAQLVGLERLQPRQDVLETRQWDYLSRSKNPLFHLVTESNRMELLLRYSEPDNQAVVVSVDCHKSSPTTTTTGKQRKQSSSSTSSSSSRRENSFTERFNDVFTKADVSHFRVELEDIRAMRSIKDATGCSCHRLKVYIPPEHGAGKTAQKKRLAIHKVKIELKKRNLLPKDDHAVSREELERILHDAVEKEGCCDYDCPCYQNGIGCQSDACDCWQQSYKENNTTSFSLTTQDIRNRCGNRLGMYTVDMDVIDEYRRNVLEKLTYCPPVQDEDLTTTTATTKPALLHNNNKFFGRKLSKLAT